jgi:predicted DNA binding CopG/RHH family protein
MKKRIPNKVTDDPLAEDLSGYLGKLKWTKTKFAFAPKDSTVTLRIPRGLVDMAKKVAKKKGIKYHKMMRDAIVDYVVKAA